MNRRFTCQIAVVLGMVLLALAGTAHAEKATDKTLSPYFFIENGDPSIDRFPLKETDVKVTISGVIAHVTITQTYTNQGTRPINARYIFPASTRAAVHGMKMFIGDHVITAKVKERERAQKEFNQAKKKGKSASLLKQQRPNVFSMNVANIMPNDTIRLELRYTELLVPTDGTYEFVYPTVVGPRYSNQPEALAPETDLWVKNPYLKQGTPNQTRFNILVHIATGIPLQEIGCRTHETDISWENKSVARVSLSKEETHGGNRDYILNYRLAGKEIESGLMLYEGEDENLFLLMVQPPQRVRPEHIPPREYIFVVDVSGSMHGFPLNTSKGLLKNLISGLRTTDKFNVILFAGGATVMAPESVAATQANIQQAIRLIERQRGGGGTELYKALSKGLALPRDEGVSRTMIIVTDGYITAERDVFELIQANLDRTNVFAFGIGSSVNRYLIEGMAKAGQGEPFIVTSPDETDAASARFRDYVASPVLTEIKLEFNGFEIYDQEPSHIPDMFAERPVVLFGKWRGEAAGTIQLSGVSGKGAYVQSFNVAETAPLEENHPLRYLWARTRIARLSDFNPQHNKESRLEITNLGLTYNLLTAYTSFIAVLEKIRNVEGSAKDVKQPLPLPMHVSNLAVGSSVSVPEPGLLAMLAFGALVLIFLWVYKRSFKDKGAFAHARWLKNHVK